KNILRGLNEVAFRIAKETEAFARNLNDAFAEFRLALLSAFRCAFHRFGSNGIAATFASDVVTGFVVRLVEIVVAIPAVIVTPATVAAPPALAALLGWTRGSRLGFQRRLVLVFFVHKLQRPIVRRSERTADSSAEGNYFSSWQLGQHFVGNI